MGATARLWWAFLLEKSLTDEEEYAPSGAFAHPDWDFRTDTELAPRGGGKAEEGSLALFLIL